MKKYEFSASRARNGIILQCDDEIFVFQSNDNETENWTNFLYELTNMFGPMANKYSDERIYINVAPGYHNDKWDGLVCPLCMNVNEHEDEDAN